MYLIHRFNWWYDQLPEPTRFLLFISVMALAIFPIHLGMAFHSRALGMFWLAVLFVMSFIAATRAMSFAFSLIAAAVFLS